MKIQDNVGILVWIFPEADPETRIPLQVVYLRDEPRENSKRGRIVTQEIKGPKTVTNV